MIQVASLLFVSISFTILHILLSSQVTANAVSAYFHPKTVMPSDAMSATSSLYRRGRYEDMCLSVILRLKDTHLTDIPGLRFTFTAIAVTCVTVNL